MKKLFVEEVMSGELAVWGKCDHQHRRDFDNQDIIENCVLCIDYRL